MALFNELFELHKNRPLIDPKNFCDIFKKIDSEEKAYILGRMYYDLNEITSFEDLSIEENNSTEYVKLTFEQQSVPEICKDFLYCEGVICEKSIKYYTFSIPKNHVNKLNYTINDDKLKLYYYKGIIETYSSLDKFVLNLKLKNKSLLHSICNYFNLKISEETLYIKDVNLIDFLGMLYKDHTKLIDYMFFNKFQDLIYKYNCIDTKNLTWSVIKKDPDAVIPYKTNFSDIGFDVTVIKKIKDLTNTTALYDTGLVVIPPMGYCIEIFPRSSLSKSGFALANSVGLMDPSYRGNLFIPLTNTDPQKKIELPFRCCQIVLKKHYLIQLKEIESTESTESTNRGTGGFGSTGK